MRLVPFSSFIVATALIACPAPGDPQTGATGTGEPESTSGASSSGDPGSGTAVEPTTGAPASTGDTSTAGSDPVVTRVVYYTFVDVLGQPNAAAMRHVEIVDGVASPPTTIVDPPGEVLITRDATHDRRWSPVYAGRGDPAQLWLIDMQTLAPREVLLPPEIDEVLTVRLSRGDGHLMVHGAPKGVAPQDFRWYVCEIDDEGDCSLQAVEPATGPTTFVREVHEVSSASGRIWYSAQEIGGAAVTLLQGDVAAPMAAEAVLALPDDAVGFKRVSIDEATLYLFDSSVGQYQAMDISADVPGPRVPVHPPLTGTVRYTWADDEKQLLIWNGEGLFGELHRVALDGATAGPMIPFNSGAPGHVRSKGAQWTADGSHVLLLSDHETPMSAQLYLADAAAPEPPPTKLSGPLAAGGEVDAMFLGGDANHVLYYGQTNDMTPSELYRARLDPPGEVHKLNAPLPDGAFLLSGAHDVSADGARVVYAGYEVPGRRDLFLVDLDGEQPAPAVNLTGSLPADIDVYLTGRLAPDAAQAFFAGHGPDNERRGLYMVPLSPEIAPPAQISGSGEGIYSYFVLSPQ